MRRFYLAGVALVFTSGLAVAHHGWGSYDATGPLTITSTIELVTLGNPHGMMMLAHEGKTWEVTLAPLSRMRARGATAELLSAGKQIKAYGYPKRDGSLEMRAEWIEVDGKHIELR